MADHRDVRDSLGYACETAQTSKVQALETMAKRVDTHSIKESAVFLFKPAALAAQSSAGAAHRPNPDRLGIITYLATSDGARVPIQFLPPDSMTIGVPRLTAMVDLLAAATPSSSWPAAMGPPAQRSPAALYHPRPA